MPFFCSRITFFRNFARQMDRLDSYKFDLKGMQNDVEMRSVLADDDFFEAVQGTETQRGSVRVEMEMRQTAGGFQANIQFKGEVQVMCDRCLDPMMQPVEGVAELKIKLGETYEDDGDVIVVPEREGIVDLSWQVYEQIALQIPMRHVHPDGECSELMQNALSSHEAQQDEISAEDEQATDPRWEALKKLISTNN